MGKFDLVVLPYAPGALEPVISAQTLSFHHGKHLQAYVDNLNKLLPGSGYEGLALEEIVRQAPAGPVFNNAGQILNHDLPMRWLRDLRGRLLLRLKSSGGVLRPSRLSLRPKG